MDKVVVTSCGKCNAFKDAVMYAAEMMTKAFSTRTIQKTFVSSRMLMTR